MLDNLERFVMTFVFTAFILVTLVMVVEGGRAIISPCTCDCDAATINNEP